MIAREASREFNRNQISINYQQGRQSICQLPRRGIVVHQIVSVIWALRLEKVIYLRVRYRVEKRRGFNPDNSGRSADSEKRRNLAGLIYPVIASRAKRGRQKFPSLLLSPLFPLFRFPRRSLLPFTPLPLYSFDYVYVGGHPSREMEQKDRVTTEESKVNLANRVSSIPPTWIRGACGALIYLRQEVRWVIRISRRSTLSLLSSSILISLPRFNDLMELL